VSISPSNAAPVAGTPTVNTPNGSTGLVTGTVSATDANGDPLTYSGSTTTTKGTVVVNTNGTFTYTPTTAARQNADGATTDSFTVTISDGYGGNIFQTLTVAVDPGAFLVGTPTLNAATTDTGAVTGSAAFTDTAGRTLTYSTPTTTTGGGTVSINPTTGAFIYTPSWGQRLNATTDPGSMTDDFTITAINGVRAATQTVTLTVTGYPTVTAAVSTTLPKYEVGTLGLPSSFRGGSALTVGPDGTTYVGTGSHFLLAVTPDGRGAFAEIGGYGWVGYGPAWVSPGQLAVAPNGTVYLAAGPLMTADGKPSGVRLYQWDAGLPGGAPPGMCAVTCTLAENLTIDGHFTATIPPNTNPDPWNWPPSYLPRLDDINGERPGAPLESFVPTLRQVTVGPNGRIYAISDRAIMDVLNADGSYYGGLNFSGLLNEAQAWGREPLPSLIHPRFGPDGSLYAIYQPSLGDRQLIRIDTSTSALPRTPVPLSGLAKLPYAGLDDFAIGTDGSVYITTAGTGIVTVLNPDYSLRADLSLGSGQSIRPTLGYYSGGSIYANGSSIGVGPDGNVYAITGSNNIAVVSSRDLSVKSLDLRHQGNNNTYVLDIAAGPAGVAVASILNTGQSYISTIGLYTDGRPGPASVAELYGKLRDAMDSSMKTNNGVYTQHVWSRGQEHLIVYFGGTTLDQINNQYWTKNLPSYLGVVDDKQIQAIQNALVGHASDEPILLVGYSQGGMDAQNIAANGYFKGQIKGIVTFGSPMTQYDTTYPVVHLQDAGDLVPKTTELLATGTAVSLPFLSPLVALGAGTQIAYHEYVNFGNTQAGNVYRIGSSYDGSGSDGLSIHGNPQTYLEVARDFARDTDPNWAAVKDAIEPFLSGRVRIDNTQVF